MILFWRYYLCFIKYYLFFKFIYNYKIIFILNKNGIIFN